MSHDYDKRLKMFKRCFVVNAGISVILGVAISVNTNELLFANIAAAASFAFGALIIGAAMYGNHEELLK